MVFIYDGKTGAKNAPEPHIPVGYRTRSRGARWRASWCSSTHRAHVAFTVNVRSAWQAGNERVGGRGRAGGGRYTHRSLPPPWLSPADPPPCKITLCPGLDRKLLFVRRLRGEFSDNETRSFRTRYGFGPRYSRERRGGGEGRRGGLRYRHRSPPFPPPLPSSR